MLLARVTRVCAAETPARAPRAPRVSLSEPMPPQGWRGSQGPHQPLREEGTGHLQRRPGALGFHNVPLSKVALRVSLGSELSEFLSDWKASCDQNFGEAGSWGPPESDPGVIRDPDKDPGATPQQGGWCAGRGLVAWLLARPGPQGLRLGPTCLSRGFVDTRSGQLTSEARGVDLDVSH